MEQTLQDNSPLADEINNFYRERERIMDAIGRIGGIQYSRADTIVNIIFIILVVGFFSIELVFKPLPTTVSIEIGVFLVSMKIVWMIHANQKFNHFVFWVLNSLEFRMNTNTRLLEDLEKKVDLLQK
ncbi:MAG: hypothetical protein GX438_03175 [Treponema sp.]|nr:hypothetical protein [Treponema sp.]